MKKNDIHNKINQSLDLEAPDLLNKIKASDRFFIPVKKPREIKESYSLRFVLAGTIAIFVLLATFLLNSSPVDPVIASTITIDINPSIEITLDEDDKVINVRAINNDGNDIIDSALIYSRYNVDEVIALLIEKAVEKNYITEDNNVILVSVQNKNEEAKTRIINNIEVRVNLEAKKYITAVTIIKERLEEQAQQGNISEEQAASNYRITIAKLRLINSIIEEDDSYSIEDLKDLSVGRLYKLQQELLND